MITNLRTNIYKRGYKTFYLYKASYLSVNGKIKKNKVEYLKCHFTCPFNFNNSMIRFSR